MGCGGNGDRIFRHDSIRDAIFSVAQSAALAPRKEAPSLIPSSRRRPADIYLPNWKRGQSAALDITVISTMQQLMQAGAASTPGYALHVGEERKMAAHAEACRSVGVHFVPIVAETLGRLCEVVIDTIKSIGRLQGQRLGIPPPDSTRHLLPAPCHLPMEGECHPMDSPPANPPCRGGWNRLIFIITITILLLLY